MKKTPNNLIDRRRFFSEPHSPRQRQYEALRAYFLDQLPSAEVAKRFGYTVGAFRALCYSFRRGELPEFFTIGRPGPTSQPKKSAARELIVALRKRNYSIYEISETLKEQGTPLSATAVGEVLAAEGFARLPRRRDDERLPHIGPTTEAVADVRSFSLSPREFTTRVGGLFLFVPDLVRLDSQVLAERAKLPGSRMIPAEHALRASLALKLWSIERKSHVMALIADEGLGLFCGLNVMPKKSFLSEYSSRITPQKVSSLLGVWHDQLAGDKLFPGQSFNLDFHSVPYFGEDPIVQSHYLPKRSRRQPSIPTFLAEDADMCSAIQMPISARAKRLTRSSASSTSGSGNMAARRNTSSSIPNSPLLRGSIGLMRTALSSSRCAGARRLCSKKSPSCQHPLGVSSISICRSASIERRASMNRKPARASVPSASSLSKISATTSQPFCSPMTNARLPVN